MTIEMNVFVTDTLYFYFQMLGTGLFMSLLWIMFNAMVSKGV